MCELFQETEEKNCRRYIRVIKLAGSFPETLLLLEKLDEEAASEEFSAAGTLGITRTDNAVLSIAKEHDEKL